MTTQLGRVSVDIPDRAAGASVVVAHDYLTQRGGAERVALELARVTGAGRVVTTVHLPDQTFPGFADHQVVQSRNRMLHLLGSDPRRALPILASVWDRMEPVDADVVICSSSGWAHALPVTPRTRKIVYCHNPARWLYQPEDYAAGLSWPVRTALRTLSPGLKRWDRARAATADLYLANSTSVAARIAHTYGITATVVPPPVSVDAAGDLDPDPTLPERFFLTVGRARGYKGTDRVIAAFAELPEHHLVVVGTAPDVALPPNVTAVGRVSEARLRYLYATARALVSVSHEDFGLTPVEANAFGTPSLVLRAGGFLDSTQPGVSGRFIENESLEAIRAAVASFPDDWDAAAVRANAARFAPEVFSRRIAAAIAQVLQR